MKKLIFLFFFIFSLPVFSQSAGGKFGLGISLFYPTGITGKYMLSDKMGIEATLGFVGNNRTHIHGVFTYNALSIQSNFNLYVGGGLIFQERRYKEGHYRWFNDDHYSTALGIRVPVGLSYMIQKFELFGELNLNLFPDAHNGADLGLALGARYYF